MECANEDLLVLMSLAVTFSISSKEKNFIFHLKRKKKKKGKRNYKTAYRSIWDKNKEI